MTDAIDKTIERYRRGISSYVHIVVPFRHGKSDISSRYLAPYFLGHFPNDNIIQASYGATLSEDFSKDVKKITESEEYKRICEVEFDPNNNASERHVDDRLMDGNLRIFHAHLLLKQPHAPGAFLERSGKRFSAEKACPAGVSRTLLFDMGF